MRERWAADITARAEAYWTPERRLGLLGNKRLILPPVEAAPLLRALGLLKSDGSLPPESVRKYMQINHMVALLETMMLDLVERYPLVRVLDVACGSSYLTLLLAWCFRHRWHHPAQILGVDRNVEVIRKSRERAPMVLLDDLLRFEAASIDEIDVPSLWARAFGGGAEVPDIHALVALHACDTATDEALALGVALETDFIAAVPCCQAELAGSWAELAAEQASGAFAPLWSSPHLRREAAATMTDALRTLLLRGCGYQVTPMEFVPSQHTPKNTMLRAVRRGEDHEAAFEQYLSLRAALGGAGIRLEAALPSSHRARLVALEAVTD